MKKHAYRSKLTLLLGVLLIFIAGSILLGVWSDFSRTTTQGDTTPKQDTVTTTDAPSERPVEKPTATNYTVPAWQPRTLSISSINIHAYIQPVGVNDRGEMATPTNVAFTGWYTASARPGEDGVSIINGHDGGRYQDGVFKRLHNAQVGDTIEVEMGDKRTFKYVVQSLQSYTVSDAAQPLFAPAIYKKELRLITCTGTFDDKKQTFDKRLIVSAQLK